MTTVIWSTRPGAAPLAAVLDEVAGLLDGAAGFVSSARAHRAVRLADGRLHAADGPIDPIDAFSVRLFTPDAELRWVHVGGGSGDAVLLSEFALDAPGWPSRSTDAADVIDGAYALWGRRFEPHPSTAGWCRAAEGRLGVLDVPLDGPAPQLSPPGQEWPLEYLALTYREYVGLDEHGNAHVVEERLLAITRTTATVGAAEG